MKKIISIVMMVVVASSMTGCGEEPLKFRNLIEADQYIRNNIQQLTWNEFKALTYKENNVTQQDFNYLKGLLNEEYSSFQVDIDDKFYRFNRERNLMYMTKWEKVNGTYYLEDISYVKKEKS